METLRGGYELLRDNPRSFFAKAQRPLPIHLKGGFSSSLYSLRAGRDIRLIMAVDDDPVFRQILVTLFRVVRQDEVGRSYRSVAHLLYRNRIGRNGGDSIRYAVIYEKGPTSWGAYVPDLPGVVSVGDSRDEVERLIQEAIEFHLEGMREEGMSIPLPSSFAGVVEIKPAA
jgi:predicted RNase H-like HicB family nuclease